MFKSHDFKLRLLEGLSQITQWRRGKGKSQIISKVPRKRLKQRREKSFNYYLGFGKLFLNTNHQKSINSIKHSQVC